MPKKKKIKPAVKAAKTKKGIERLFNKFSETALDNRIRWNYEAAKKIYIKSKKEKISQKKLLSEKVEKSFKQKSYYVAKKYRLEIEEAREVVRDRIILDVPYKENRIIFEEREREETLGLITEKITGRTALMFFGDYLQDISLKNIFYNGVEYTKEKFIQSLPEIKKELQFRFELLGINADYSRSITFFEITEIKEAGKTISLIINMFDDEKLIKEAERVQRNNKDWQVMK